MLYTSKRVHTVSYEVIRSQVVNYDVNDGKDRVLISLNLKMGLNETDSDWQWTEWWTEVSTQYENGSGSVHLPPPIPHVPEMLLPRPGKLARRALEQLATGRIPLPIIHDRPYALKTASGSVIRRFVFLPYVLLLALTS